MSAFYDEMAEVAAQLIAEFGAEVILIKRGTNDSYDPVTGVASSNPDTEYTSTGVLTEYSTEMESEGSAIRRGDKRLLISPELSVAPAEGDAITHDGESWSVVDCKTLKPAETVLFYDVHVRK